MEPMCFHLNQNAAGWKRGKQLENHSFTFVFTYGFNWRTGQDQ